MTYYLKYQTRNCSKIIDYLQKNSELSPDNYDSSQEAFFLQNSSNKFKMGFKTNSYFPDNLPNDIKRLFEIIGEPGKETYMDRWTIMSYKKAIENYDHYSKDGQTRVFDIAYMYAGMGHIIVISCDLKTRKLFTRPDGGSNGWDREFNYKKLLEYSGTDKEIDFNEWFYDHKNYEKWYS
tara:strand:+ start:3738 stop:4274 length:537 start_codon:yes stop_codon:yes gene_type:complete